MSEKKQILIPLDGSPFSLQVLESVKQFLPPEEHRLTLLQVVAEPMGIIAGPSQPAAAAGGVVYTTAGAGGGRWAAGGGGGVGSCAGSSGDV